MEMVSEYCVCVVPRLSALLSCVFGSAFLMCSLGSLAGDAQFNEAMGYPMMQQWRVRSNLYRVKLSSITLSAGTAHLVCLQCLMFGDTCV